MLLRNARVGGRRSDIRIDGGVIAEIGQLEGDGIDLDDIDLDGRFVTPGLWDEHVHFNQWALNAQRLDVSGAGSAHEVAALVGQALGSAPREVTFVARGFRDGMWGDAPNLADLDAVSGGHPVVIISADLHATWLNSAALARYGHAGHPTGLLREEPAFDVTRRVGEVPEALLDGWVQDAARHAAQRGVVGVVDLEMGWNLDTWQRRMGSGFDSLRVEFGVYRQHLDRAIELGLHTGRSISELLTVGRFKILTDGSLNTRTAYCAAHYPGQPGQRGLLEVDPAELAELVGQANRAGIESSVHAIGDAANTVALDAFEAVGCGGRIEHAQLVSDSDFARFAALGVVASVQPEHAMDDRDVADRYWDGWTDRAYAWRRFLDAGATLAFGSDAPVAPLDPWVTMAAAVGRARDGREPWMPDQRLDVSDAIAASTRSTVLVGQPADLVITDLDPAAVGHEQLRAMPVAATLLAGRFTFSEI